MNSKSTTVEELNQKYPPLKVPQNLLDLIEKRKNGYDAPHRYGKFLYVALGLIPVAMVVVKGILGGDSYLYLLFAILPVIIISEMWTVENRKIANHIFYLGESRAMPGSTELDILWESRKKADIARKINNLCIEQIGWKENTIFLPDDPFCLMIELYTGDLCEVEAIMAIEEDFSIKFPKTFFIEEIPGELKFQYIVDYIFKNKQGYFLK